MDGVLICGDLTDNGVVPQLEELARIWDRIFPGSKGLDGEHVERLFHCGDHDNWGHWMLGGKEGDDVRGKYGWTEEQLAANACFKHPTETWERIFGEPWAPLVQGSDFILSHYTKRGWKCAEGLKTFLAGFKPDPAKPFFYSQHRVLRNTVCVPGNWETQGWKAPQYGCVVDDMTGVYRRATESGNGRRRARAGGLTTAGSTTTGASTAATESSGPTWSPRSSSGA